MLDVEVRLFLRRMQGLFEEFSRVAQLSAQVPKLRGQLAVVRLGMLQLAEGGVEVLFEQIRRGHGRCGFLHENERWKFVKGACHIRFFLLWSVRVSGSWGCFWRVSVQGVIVIVIVIIGAIYVGGIIVVAVATSACNERSCSGRFRFLKFCYNLFFKFKKIK